MNANLSFDGTTFKEEASSSYSHDKAGALSIYKGSAFITGGGNLIHDYVSTWFHAKTEILDYEAKQWNSAENYPYASW